MAVAIARASLDDVGVVAVVEAEDPADAQAENTSVAAVTTKKRIERMIRSQRRKYGGKF